MKPMQPFQKQALRVCMCQALGAAWERRDDGVSAYACALNLIRYVYHDTALLPMSEFAPHLVKPWLMAQNDRERCALALQEYATHRGKENDQATTPDAG